MKSILLFDMKTKTNSNISCKNLSWNSLIFFIFISSFFYILFEWLFYITKPSFLNSVKFTEQVEILLFAICLLSITCYMLVLPFFILSLITPETIVEKNLFIYIGCLFPIFLWSSILLLLFDNFTYTVFLLGIISAKGLQIIAYAGLFFGFGILSFYYINNILLFLSSEEVSIIQRRGFPIYLLICILAVFSGLIWKNGANHVFTISERNSYGLRPNILWITGDGLDASSMSVYGYSRDTTPTLRQLSSSSRVFDDAFSNAGNTTGSIVSMLTGKYPSKTRVLHPPDILRGDESYQHLPGILKATGYTTTQLTMRYYADAYELNMLNGFDHVNNRQPLDGVYVFRLISNTMPADFYIFIEELCNRIFDRLGYIFLGKESINPFEQVMKNDQSVDQEKLQDLFKIIDQSKDRPWFVEIHFLGTHGPTFHILHQNFSMGQDIKKKEYWNKDFYDDSILEFDENVKLILEKLIKAQILDQTIIILGSDHGSQWDQTKRIPLLIRFPHGEFSGHIKSNVSNLDIAPTILDYLNIEKQYWMDGLSLISEETSRNPVIGFTVSGLDVYENSINSINPTKIFPPFYQFGQISLINCQKWYKLNLVNTKLISGTVEGSKAACTKTEDLDDSEVFSLLVRHLENEGFDTSIIMSSFPQE